MKQINVTVDSGREVAEIAQDFARPIEVIREALHNAYDAGAKHVDISAFIQTLPDGRRVLSLEIIDDGDGMNDEQLDAFFGLGKSLKLSHTDHRSTIGYKGHGTKIYYQAQEIHLVTRVASGDLTYARVTSAREAIMTRSTPKPESFAGPEAIDYINNAKLNMPSKKGTALRLVDFTPDSSRLIDEFRSDRIENYLRWFTIYGSFEHMVNKKKPHSHFQLRLRGTESEDLKPILFGHNWPENDRTSLAALKREDDRRPFNYFQKSFRFATYTITDGYKIDVAILFEGKRARYTRDSGIVRQRVGGIYAEEERYGVWLCRDFIPIEFRPDWLLDTECPALFPDLRRPLVLVNSQDFKLIANRGSVGNSSPQLLSAVKEGVFKIIGEVQTDKDITRFLEEYQEDLFGRLREKDKKALQRRVDRYNHKELMTIILPDNRKHNFWEPQREITLFGLIAELQLLDPSFLGFEILDYDDHNGIDLLVRKNGTGQLHDKQKVAYVELKYDLENQVNHAFDHLHAIVCWTTGLSDEAEVSDATGVLCVYREHKGKDKITTYSQLVPHADSSLTHNIRVIVLRRLLEEKFKLQTTPNPRQVKKI